ncbi:histidine phosphatase family protein [Lacticaseibacillus thailandensis]|uniref:Phosphoglycerate mutase n=1 Tax=Lacticaseibacillus thailandensis DSM 22698 = JCM 13996 TaxID=1423810 RepID=A0A0R2C477_9LACO|nr:histidine phosphatase family protein [Lacticaseibacillus thailandensis]KRM86497.1 hypothetical protein FD19_GL001927 [Lacticaseibacillus thailandensis DSM 22698 = JCM 13996]
MAYLYLVRHGETILNADDRVNGGTVDSPLTAQGVASAQALGKLLAGVHFDRIITSPIKRAVTTTRLVVGEQVPIITDTRLREMTLGDWDGLPVSVIADDPEFHHFNEHLDAFNAQAMHAETIAHLWQRGHAALRAAVAGVPADGHVLVVAHAIILTLLARVLTGTTSIDGARTDGELVNTSVTVLRDQPGAWAKLAWEVTPDRVDTLTPAQRALFNLPAKQ